uniref:hypothetical protein n=1 Tax=Shimia sp. TaxID=1954381 RepID=UPI003565260F
MKALVCSISLALVASSLPAQAQTLWSTQHVRPSDCGRFSKTAGTAEFSTTLQGFKWPLQKGSGALFVWDTAAHLNAAAIGRAKEARLRERLLAAARSGAFTKLDFEGPGGSSPAFVSTTIIKSVAHSVDYLRGRNALSSQDVKEIGSWVGKLSKNSKVRATSKDHRAAILVSQLMWTAATDDQKGFSRNLRQFDTYLRALRKAPYFTSDLRNNNEVMQHIVHGAAILHMNGVDRFSPKFGQYSLNDAVTYHANQVRANGTAKIGTAGDPHDQARSIMRADGHGTHLAWIPVFLA